MSTERSASGRGTSLRVRMCAVKKDHVTCVEQMAGLVQKGQEFILALNRWLDWYRRVKSSSLGVVVHPKAFSL